MAPQPHRALTVVCRTGQLVKGNQTLNVDPFSFATPGPGKGVFWVPNWSFNFASATTDIQ